MECDGNRQAVQERYKTYVRIRVVTAIKLLCMAHKKCIVSANTFHGNTCSPSQHIHNTQFYAYEHVHNAFM